MDLAQRILNGERRAAARLLTLIENRDEETAPYLERINAHTGRAHVVGVTGPPGGGKSTLIKELASEFRGRGRTVGIIAIDPSSPLTGGAILGDRIRMHDLSSDPGVFIRSMANKGLLGGLSRAAADAIKVLGALGSQIILVETVGVGQCEIEIIRVAHTTVVVEVPGMGDDVQAIKAGILEIADVFAVNKADRDGADRLVIELESISGMSARTRSWIPPVVRTIASSGSGVAELADALDSHFEHLRSSGELQMRLKRNVLRELFDAAKEEFVGELSAQLGESVKQAVIQAVLEQRISPRSAAKQLVRRFRG